jgi:hypothetical protein
VANKKLLVKLEIEDCRGIRRDGYDCVSTLTNLTSLTIFDCLLDDIGLFDICSSCLLIEYLDVQNFRSIRINELITIEGLDNINCLVNLKSLFLTNASDDWLEQLSNNIALEDLELSESTISDEGLARLCSLLVNLTSVHVNGEERLK